MINLRSDIGRQSFGVRGSQKRKRAGVRGRRIGGFCLIYRGVKDSYGLVFPCIYIYSCIQWWFSFWRPFQSNPKRGGHPRKRLFLSFRFRCEVPIPSAFSCQDLELWRHFSTLLQANAKKGAVWSGRAAGWSGRGDEVGLVLCSWHVSVFFPP